MWTGIISTMPISRRHSMEGSSSIALPSTLSLWELFTYNFQCFSSQWSDLVSAMLTDTSGYMYVIIIILSLSQSTSLTVITDIAYSLVSRSLLVYLQSNEKLRVAWVVGQTFLTKLEYGFL